MKCTICLTIFVDEIPDAVQFFRLSDCSLAQPRRPMAWGVCAAHIGTVVGTDYDSEISEDEAVVFEIMDR